MASVVAARIFLFLYICYSSMLIINATNDVPLSNENNLKNFFLRYNRFRSSKKIDSNLSEESSTPSVLLNFQRRSVILPRICYFARISGTNNHQKLCLPYNDIRS